MQRNEEAFSCKKIWTCFPQKIEKVTGPVYIHFDGSHFVQSVSTRKHSVNRGRNVSLSRKMGSVSKKLNQIFIVHRFPVFKLRATELRQACATVLVTLLISDTTLLWTLEKLHAVRRTYRHSQTAISYSGNPQRLGQPVITLKAEAFNLRKFHCAKYDKPARFSLHHIETLRKRHLQ